MVRHASNIALNKRHVDQQKNKPKYYYRVSNFITNNQSCLAPIVTSSYPRERALSINHQLCTFSKFEYT